MVYNVVFFCYFYLSWIISGVRVGLGAFTTLNWHRL